MSRHIERSIIGRECVLHLGPAPRFLCVDSAGADVFVFVEDDARPAHEPWTVVMVGVGDSVPERALYVGTAFALTEWKHVYAYRGAPRREQTGQNKK